LNDPGKEISRLAFDERGADYLLAVREEYGNAGPAFVAKGEDVGDIRTDIPYQLVTILRKIYPYMEDGKIAVVIRRCEEKALNELIKRGIIDGDRIIRIGLACSEGQIEACRCTDPVPSCVDIGSPGKGWNEDQLSKELSAMSSEERLDFWVAQFRKCNKCYACSTNCPVCVCDHCVLEECTFVAEKGIPPGMAFHLIRAYHLSDKCTECGECERSCPAHIPLLTFRKMTNRDMKDLYGYESGDTETVSPLLTTLEGDLLEEEED